MKDHPLVKWLAGLSAISQAAYFYLLATFCDYASTILATFENPGQIGEQNAFARDRAFQFLPSHALVQDGLYVAVTALGAWVLWGILRHWSERVANTAVALGLWWFAWSRFSAVLNNLLMAAKFYVPDPASSIIFGEWTKHLG